MFVDFAEKKWENCVHKNMSEKSKAVDDLIATLVEWEYGLKLKKEAVESSSQYIKELREEKIPAKLKELGLTNEYFEKKYKEYK